MQISLASIGSRRGKGKREAEELLCQDYLSRSERYAGTTGFWAETEAAFWGRVESFHTRVPARVILLDGGGRLLTSVEFAETIRNFRDRGSQHIVVAIGGADGWSAESLARADLVVSMGRITLPHGLARVVAAEQIYRAMTILAGHPYHCGH